MSVDEPATCFHRMFPGIEGTVAVVDLCVCLIIELVGTEVEGSTKSAGPVGRSTYAALQLDAVHRRSKVRHVHKESTLGFCIVHRNTIDGNIDPGDVATTNTEPCITYAGPCIRVGHYGRQLVEQQGQVLPEVLPGNIFFAEF